MLDMQKRRAFTPCTLDLLSGYRGPEKVLLTMRKMTRGLASLYVL